MSFLEGSYTEFVVFLQLPWWALTLLCLSKRVHSIFVLRLFNDCIATTLLNAALATFLYQKWWLGLIIFRYYLLYAIFENDGVYLALVTWSLFTFCSILIQLRSFNKDECAAVCPVLTATTVEGRFVYYILQSFSTLCDA